jgi:predicted ABC-type ATPase
MAGLRFLNAENLAAEMKCDAYTAARLVEVYRQKLVEEKERFVFETVLSDPVGDKVDFLQKAAASGYEVVMFFIGLEDSQMSDQRVALRVNRGGHDVPEDKIHARFPRTMLNLRRAIEILPWVLVYDNSDLELPFHRIATFHNGSLGSRLEPWPQWLREAAPGGG